MEDTVAKFLGKLTELVSDLKDTKTGDAPSMDHPGIIKNAFDKSESQKKSDDNTKLADSIAEANAEQRKAEEEEKGRRIMKTVMPMTITSIDPKAAKQLKDVLGSDKSTSGTGGPTAKESEGMFGWLLGLIPMLGTIGSVVMTVIGTIGTVVSTVLGIIAGPIGLVILAVTALAAFFTGFWEEWEETGDFGAAMIAGVGEIFDWLIAIPATLLKDLTTWAMRKMGFEEEADFIDEHWDDFLATWKEIVLAPITILVGAFENLWDGITQIWDGVKDFFSGIGALLTGDFEKAGEKFESAFGNIINGLWDWIWALPNSAINWVMEFLGFKEPGSEPINLGDMLWDTMLAIFDWFKLLFTSPEEAFKKIGDWFDRLFDDPVAAFREIMPDWLVDFGVWIWDHTLGPIVDLWCDIVGDPEGAKEAFLNLMPDWLRDIAEWIWDRTIGPAVELWNYIFDHPDGAKAAFKSLFPEWLWDIMEWIYDHTLGPIVGIFSDLFDGKDIEATFRKYLPDWLVDTFLWIKENVFGGITKFFGKLFDGDVEGALRSILPDWLVDGLMWVVDNVFGPITEFWKELFSGNIEDAFRKILPDWLVDIGKWLYDKISPLFDWFDGIFDWFSGDGMMKWAKANLHEKVYNALYGDKEKQIQHEKEQKELLEKTGAQATAGGGRDYGKEMKDMQKELQNTFTQFEDHTSERGGKVTGIGTSAKYNTLRLKQDIKNKAVRAGSLGSSTVIDSVLQEMYMKGSMKGTDGKETELSKKIRSWLGTGTVPWQKGYELNDANRDQIAKIMNARMYADESFGDDVRDSMDADVEELGLLAAKSSGDSSVYFNMFQKLQEKIRDLQGIPLGSDFLRAAINYDDNFVYKDKDGEEVQGKWIVKTLSAMLNPGGAETARKYLDAYKNAGGHYKPEYDIILGHVMDTWGFNHALIDSLAAAYDPAADPNAVPSGIDLKKGKKLDDFIMRPGQDPVAFNKGDILLGIHKDNPAPVSGSPELINRVDQMVMTLKENKDLQAKMLEAMIESGMMKKQGNTVVNNGGNSTVVNNTTTESNIMSFRDKVVGRISNSSTKYK